MHNRPFSRGWRKTTAGKVLLLNIATEVALSRQFAVEKEDDAKRFVMSHGGSRRYRGKAGSGKITEKSVWELGARD